MPPERRRGSMPPHRSPSRRRQSAGRPRARHTLRRRPRGNTRIPPRPAPRTKPRALFRGTVNALRMGTHLVTSLTRRILPWLGASAVLLGAVALGRLVERHMRTSPYFALRHVRIEGTERLDPKELKEATGLLQGRNIFELSPRRVERALLAHPWVAGAHVRRRLPDTFDVAIRERHATAAASRGGDIWLIDESGEPFGEAPPGERMDLPLVTGLAWSAPRRLRAQLQRAIALIADWRTLGLTPRARLDEIHFEPGDTLTLWLTRPRLRVHLAASDDRFRLRLLRRALDRVRRERLPVHTIALDHERHPRRVTLRTFRPPQGADS